MAQKTRDSRERKSLTLLLICGIILLLIFTAHSVFGKEKPLDLNTPEGREAYLKSLGWDIDRDSESFRSVVVPQKLEGIMAQYNKIQLKQGFDLNKHLGESCRQYCYDVTNYPGGDGQGDRVAVPAKRRGHRGRCALHRGQRLHARTEPQRRRKSSPSATPSPGTQKANSHRKSTEQRVRGFFIINYSSMTPAFSQISWVSLSQMEACTSPMWALPSSSMDSRDWPMPPPMVSGSSPASRALW